MSRGKKQGFVTNRQSQGALPSLDLAFSNFNALSRSLPLRTTYFAQTKNTPGTYQVEFKRVELEILAKVFKTMVDISVPIRPFFAVKYSALLTEILSDVRVEKLTVAIMNTDNNSDYPELTADYSELKARHSVLGRYTMNIPGSMIKDAIISPSRKNLSPDEDLWLDTLWKLCDKINPF